jgi:ATP-dependent Lon protease
MESIPASLPVLPIRNAVLFPSISMPLVVGRERSIKAVETAEEGDRLIVVIAQKNITSGDPQPEDIYSIGTLCKLESTNENENGGRQIVVTGISRYRVLNFQVEAGGYLSARGETLADLYSPDDPRNRALFNELKEISREILDLLPGTTEPLMRLIDRIEDASYLTHICATYLNLTLLEKQELLEVTRIESRMEKLLKYMQKEREVLQVQSDIRDKISERMNKAQREALLREQLRTIRTELGEDGGEEASDELEKKLKEAQLPEAAAQQAAEELKRLRGLPSASSEYHVVRTYLDWLASLPWEKKTESKIDVQKAREILDADHYGLERVKKRILQYLAVAKLKNDLHGPILCLLGPPGVGKTSLGASVAKALGRKFIRTSLGGVRDEAEIRGHRRTYVGAMPGRIIQSLKRCGTRNPVLLLDEIDKLRADFHGDPSSAMLEVLDPEQNKTFVDHYIDTPFDLSDVFFIATANVIETIPAPLRDRMEVIEVNGYTDFEKLHIAENYLLPRQLKEHGLASDWVEIPTSTLERIISHYTREAGVRELNRKLAALARAIAEAHLGELEELQGLPTAKIALPPERLPDLLGPERFFPEQAEKELKPGVVTGLAWTPHGGDILYIEATAMSGGKGNLILTGQLGDVMKESAQIALSLSRSILPLLREPPFDFTTHDIHIHVPSGAIPKDGPSAGVTILTALLSLLLGKSIRPATTMTGEITLRGAVMPVGGIKEKVLAAHRSGYRTILLPSRNKQDINDIPSDIRAELEFHWVESIEDLLTITLGIPKAPFEVFREKPAA